MIRVEKRKEPLRCQGAVAASFAVVMAFMVGCLIFAGLGVHPLTAYMAMGKGVFSSVDAFSEVLVKATPLIFTGLAVATAATMRLWNI
jgi:general nucleoside transport system permease protein